MAISFIKTQVSGPYATFTLLELENDLVSDPFWLPCGAPPNSVRRVIGKLVRTVPLTGRAFRFFKKEESYFAVLMGVGDIRKAYPQFLVRARRKSIYLFDAWEPEFPAVKKLIVSHGIDTVFFSAKRSAEYFSEKLGRTRSHWVPEGISDSVYSAAPYEDKDIEVMQFGRRHDAYHNAIFPFCEANKIKYLFEAKKGEVVFPDRKDFIDGLARTRISICFPSNLTHPERSGGISTMTQRYLQSMVAKCLVVGAMPDDMRELFDYAPIVEADMADPAGQLRKIIENYKDYLPLIEKNHAEVIHKHRWLDRMKVMRSVLAENG